MASLLSIISLNTNKRSDLGGLHSIIRGCQPHLVFLQEVKSTQILTSLASAYNYQVFASTLIQPQRPRICAILSRLPATTVLEILPGKAQMASIGALSFINIHAPTDDREAREALFSSLRTHLSLPVPPPSPRRLQLRPPHHRPVLHSLPENISQIFHNTCFSS